VRTRASLVATAGAVLAATVLTGCEPAPPPSWDPSILELNAAGLDSAATDAVLSPDGLLVAFITWRGLVPEDTNGWQDLYVHDLLSGDTSLVTANLAGGTSSEPGYPSDLTFSADGTRLAFASDAQDLVPEPTGGWRNVFVRDLTSRTTTLVSVNAAGTAGAAGHSSRPTISPDGTKVAFASSALDLGPRVYGIYDDLFLRDVEAGTTSLLSIRNDGEPGYGGLDGPVWFTPDGATVIFSTWADLTGSFAQYPQLYARDLASGTTSVLSANAAGEPADYGVGTSVLSPDGTRVAFTSAATNLLPTDTNGEGDVFVRDLATGTTTLVSSDASGTGSGNGRSGGPVFSRDGGSVAFTSFASNLGPADENAVEDIYVRDLRTGTTSLVTVDTDGHAVGGENPAFDNTGTRLTFVSRSGDLGPRDTNRLDDVYVRDLVHGVTSLVSANIDGTDSGDSWSMAPAFTFDGAIIFSSAATDLDPRQTADSHDIFRATPPATADVVVGTAVAGPSGDDTEAVVTVWVSNDGPDAAAGTRVGIVVPDGMTTVSATTGDRTCDVSTGEPPAVVVCDLGDRAKWTTATVEVVATVDVADRTHTVIAAAATDAYDPDPADNVSTADLSPPEPPDPPGPSGTIRQLTNRAEGQSGGDSRSPIISADGRYVAFTSTAPDLVPGDDNFADDVFVWDRATGATSRITDGNDGSHSPAISADGSHIAFSSWASDLTPGDDNGRSDVFVWERGSGATTRITDGDGDSWGAAISADGGRVSFESGATDLVPGDTNGEQDVFVWDGTAHTTTRVSDGVGASNNSGISGDGRHVAYTAFTSQLVPDDANDQWDVFVWDATADTTTRIGGAGGHTLGPVLSDDGRSMAFWSAASDLVPGDTDGPGIYVRDATTGSVERVAAGGEDAMISADGRYITFVHQGELAKDVFLWEAATGVATKLTDGNDESLRPSVSADGASIAFSSDAFDLVPGESDRLSDIFLWERDTT
jgi:Tol biopolymer transport system component